MRKKHFLVTALLGIALLMPGQAFAWTYFPTGSKWYWQLKGTLKTNIAPHATVYDIDLFDTPKQKISSLKSLGKTVICYFSAGSYENWRSDAGKFKSSDLGKPLDGWAGERWLNINSENVKTIMKARLDLAKQKGCNGVEPDNVDGYANNNGLRLTATQQLAYNRFLATEAHHRNLAIGLKNDTDQVKQLEPYFDFAVVEQCHEYAECSAYLPFKTKNKAIFSAEYAKKYRTEPAFSKMCTDAKKYGMYSVVFSINLDGSYQKFCP